MVIILQVEHAVWVEVEQTLHCLYILNLIVKDLPLEQEVLKAEDDNDIYRKNAREDGNKPNGKTGTNICWMRDLHC
jgi:hypothetical protein